MKYRNGSHTRYSIYYHIVFVPKYRREVLTGRVEERLKEVISRIAFVHDWLIEAMEVMPDHVHLFLSAPPRYSPAQIVNITKSYTHRQIYKEYKEVRQMLWGGSLWCDGYFVSTVNDKTTKEQVKRYIEDQKKDLKQMKLWDITENGT